MYSGLVLWKPLENHDRPVVRLNRSLEIGEMVDDSIDVPKRLEVVADLLL
jgi:hypothetical protein